MKGTINVNRWAHRYNDTSASSNAAMPCKNGTYWGVRSGNVTFPSGFTPHTSTPERHGAFLADSTDTSAADDVVIVEVNAVETRE